MKRKNIVVLGSSNTDMIIQVERIPRPGETILGGRFAVAAGGKGANQAVGAARAGGQVTLVARIGRDLFGDQSVAGFRRDGINVRYVFRDPDMPSGVALIFVAANGENSIGVAAGANAKLSPSDVRKASVAIRSASVLVMQLETPLETVSAAAKIAAKAGVPAILNPAPAQPLPDALLREITLLTPNEHEAGLLTGIKVQNAKSAAKAAAVLRARGVKTVIITLGCKGAFYLGEGRGKLVPGFRVKALDTTAAGDIFNGALAVALAEDSKIESAVRFANAAAAISVTRLGAQVSAPKRAEIEHLISC